MKRNNWKAFSRGIAVAVLIAATICGLCGLGAALAQIPWFFIAGAICFLLIAGSAIWFLGYKSRQVQPVEEEPVVHPTQEVIIIRKNLTPEEFDKAYNMFASDDDTSDDDEEV